jgi:ABC-type transporter Mla subunit MlaD
MFSIAQSPHQFLQLSQSEALRRREEETHRQVQMQLQEQLHASIKTLTSRFGSEKSELQRAAGQSQQELADLLSQYRDRLSQTVEQAAALQQRVVDLETALDRSAAQVRSAELEGANARARMLQIEQVRCLINREVFFE